MADSVKKPEIEKGKPAGVLVGRFDHGLDKKMRLTIPSEWRSALGQPEYVYVFPDPHEECIDLVPREEMDARIDKLRKAALFDPEMGKVLQAIGEFAEQLELDVQGRIRIGDRLLKYAGLSGQVAMVGAINRAKLWNPAKLPPAEEVDVGRLRAALAKYAL